MMRWIGGGTVVLMLLAAGATGGTAGLDLPASATAGVTTGGPMTLPVSPAVITQGFGCTPYTFEPTNPACPSVHWHSGLDLAAPAGTPVHAAIGGVAKVLESAGGYGRHIIVDHGGGLSTLYGHLSAALVATGSLVDRDQVIGRVGSTGNSTGPHLHFEIRRNGTPEDPAPELHLR